MWSSTNFFSKSSNNLDIYISSIEKWIKICSKYNIIDKKYLDALLMKISNDYNSWSTIQRDDILYFWDNIESITNNIESLSELRTSIKNIDFTRPDIEISYELVSLTQENHTNLKKRQLEIERANILKEHEKQEKLKQEKELENLLNSL